MSVAENDYYGILGVARSADQREIKAAFRRLAWRYHPDVNGGDAAAERLFKRVHEAYATLSDPLRRCQYDALTGPRPAGRSAGVGARPSTPGRAPRPPRPAARRWTGPRPRSRVAPRGGASTEAWHRFLADERAAALYVAWRVRRLAAHLNYRAFMAVAGGGAILGMAVEHLLGQHPL